MVAIAIMTFSALCHDVRASEPALSRGQEENAGAVALFSGLSPADGDLLGTWTIDRVKVKKTVGGVSSENIYSSGQRFETIIPCPQRWRIINSKELEMYFEDGRKEVLEYELGDGHIAINCLGAIFHYSYSVNNNTMTLTSTFECGDKIEYLVVDLKK